jgi:thiamine transport system permease protein
VTAFAGSAPDPQRSLTRQLGATTLPSSLRVVGGAAAALLLLWPLFLYVPDATNATAWPSTLWSALWFSLWRTLLSATIGVALSIPLAWTLARVALPARSLLRGLVTLPIVLPALAIGLGSGWLLSGPVPLLIGANVGFGLAIGVRLGGGAWAELNPEVIQAARTLGLAPIQVLRQYLLPVLGRPFAAAWLLAAAISLTSFGTAYILAPGSSSSLPKLAVGGTVQHPEAAAAAALLQALVVFAALVVFIHYRPSDAPSRVKSHLLPLRSLPLRDRLLIAAAWLAGLLIVLGPVFAVLHGAITIGAAEQVTGANVTGLIETARPFEVDPTEAMRRSLMLAGLALAAAVPLGIVISLVIAPLRGWSAGLVEAALLVPLLLAVPLAAGLRAGGVDGSLALLFVHLSIALPLVVRAVLPGLRTSVRPQFEAATVLGASRWASWRRLIAPPLRAHIAVAIVLGGAWSLGNLGAALILERLDRAPVPAAIAAALESETSRGDGRAFALSGILALLIAAAFVTLEHRRPPEITEF